MRTAVAVPVAGWAGALVWVFWVAAVAGLLLGVAWRRVEDPRRRRGMQWAASVLFFVPHLPVLLAWNVAAPLVTLQRALLAVWLLGSAAVALVALRRTAAATRRSQVVTVLVAAGMAAGGLVLGEAAVRNLRSPTVSVAGQLRQVGAGYRTYAPVLEVAGQRVRATRDVAGHLRDGMTIEGRALAGTGHLVEVRIVGR